MREQRGTDLLIASAGGHLTQLELLSRRVASRKQVWGTYRGTPAALALPIAATVHAFHPTTKHLPNAVRNYRLATRTFSELEIDRVISTGAAVAVPFMLRARQLGIPCHYIESATRVAGPSLSGHMLRRLRGVRLYRQVGSWGEPRWQQGPCVFDGFTIEPKPVDQVRRVFVSLGTHRYPFTELIARLADLLKDGRTEVIWQLGSTAELPGLPGQLCQLLPPDELQSTIRDADVVVGHAGVGLTLTCLQAGKVPVLVPRRRSRREHTDDHQQQLAGELARQGLAVVAQVGELSIEHLEQAAGLVATYVEPPPFELLD